VISKLLRKNQLCLASEDGHGEDSNDLHSVTGDDHTHSKVSPDAIMLHACTSRRAICIVHVSSVDYSVVPPSHGQVSELSVMDQLYSDSWIPKSKSLVTPEAAELVLPYNIYIKLSR
jgi:hypothetical protein